jgi:hypothetical protein
LLTQSDATGVTPGANAKDLLTLVRVRNSGVTGMVQMQIARGVPHDRDELLMVAVALHSDHMLQQQRLLAML